MSYLSEEAKEPLQNTNSSQDQPNMMLRWKREETNGLLQLKNLAEKLRSIRHPEIAEQLEP